MIFIDKKTFKKLKVRVESDRYDPDLSGKTVRISSSVESYDKKLRKIAVIATLPKCA